MNRPTAGITRSHRNFILSILFLIAVSNTAACGGGETEPEPGSPDAVAATATVAAEAGIILTPTPEPETREVRPGPWVEIFGTDSCLNIRTDPGLEAAVLGCQPDESLAQVVEGPQQKDGHRWWRIVAEFPLRGGDEGFESLTPIIKGWAAEEFIRFQDSGRLTYKGFTIGSKVGDFTAELIRVLPPPSPEMEAFMVLFSGETTIEGQYSYTPDCGWSFTPSAPSMARLPRSEGLESGGFFFRESKEREVARLLAPEVAPGEESAGITGAATIVITNYVHSRLPGGCSGDYADLVRVIE